MSNLSGYEVQVGFQSQHITVCICTLNLFKASIWWCLEPAAQFRPDSWPRTFAGVPPYDELKQRLIWSITLLYKLAPQPPFCSATYVRPTIRSQFCETFPRVPHYPHWVKPSTFLWLLASHAVCFFSFLSIQSLITHRPSASFVSDCMENETWMMGIGVVLANLQVAMIKKDAAVSLQIQIKQLRARKHQEPATITIAMP